MELFNEKGCLTDEGLHALIGGRLDELGRLEAAEHLSYCDRCIERYTALLSGDVLQTPQSSVMAPVMKSLQVRIMQNTVGRAAVAGVAAVLALTMWGSGGLDRVVSRADRLPVQPSAPRENVMAQVWDAYDEFISGIFRSGADRPGTAAGEDQPAQRAGFDPAALWQSLTEHLAGGAEQ